MEDLTCTLNEYRQSCRVIFGRIEQLNALIAEARKQGAPTRELLDRRRLLYVEHMEMRQAIEQMEEYLLPEERRAGHHSAREAG